jgi:hypothetical protein
MVSQQSISAQLKKIGVNQHAWGRIELKELPNIIIPDEEIFECVNGIYEGGFALLVATDVRVLLVDKKPFNYLTVEDLRFDMINEIDYNHRVIGAYVSISTGNRDLKFRSYNQPRLRKLIGHVQHCMAEVKKKQASHQEGQNQHLGQINEHLQTYLVAQYRHQQELQRQLQEAQKGGVSVASLEPPRPSPELSDYLLAQGLLAQHQLQVPQMAPQPAPTDALPPALTTAGSLQDDLYTDGIREVFGNRQPVTAHNPLDINALRIAYSKLPMALRNRKFGRPSLHAHSQAEPVAKPQPQLT